jgi:hypothetical protein
MEKFHYEEVYQLVMQLPHCHRTQFRVVESSVAVGSWQRSERSRVIAVKDLAFQACQIRAAEPAYQ